MKRSTELELDPRVAVVYSSEAEAPVRQLVEALEPFRALRPGSTVVLKPNIVLSRRNWLGANTRPEVVEALVVMLREHGVQEITIADGSGMGESATRAFSICGYDEIAARHGVRLLDIERDRFVTVPTKSAGPFRELSISQTVARCDYLVNIPVIKAHCQTRMTCSLKNLKGVMPPQLKSGFHGTDLERAIAQLAELVRPDFILADGAYGDLRSELGGNPVNLGVMAAGYDPLAVDVFAAQTLGFAPREIAHLAQYARFRGLNLPSFRPDLRELNRSAGAQSAQRAQAEPLGSKRYRCSIEVGSVCSTCYANLQFALERLSEQRRLQPGDTVRIGQNAAGAAGEARAGGAAAGGFGTDRRPNAGGRTILVGDCPVREHRAARGSQRADPARAGGGGPSSRGGATVEIEGCPPSADEIVARLESHRTPQRMQKLDDRR